MSLHYYYYYYYYKQTGQHVYYYFNTCTMHVLLFCTMTKKCTIISQIITLLHVSAL